MYEQPLTFADLSEAVTRGFGQVSLDNLPVQSNAQDALDLAVSNAQLAPAQAGYTYIGNIQIPTLVLAIGAIAIGAMFVMGAGGRR